MYLEHILLFAPSIIYTWSGTSSFMYIFVQAQKKTLTDISKATKATAWRERFMIGNEREMKPFARMNE